MTPIGDFLSMYSSKNTISVYQAGLYAFFDVVYGITEKPQQSVKKKELYEPLAARYLKEKRDHVEDLMQFATNLNKRPPYTARSYLGAVREFLGNNKIVITRYDQKRIKGKLPKGSARTMETDLDLETLRSILQHCDVKGRALILTLLSSGMRIGESLQIKIDDVLRCQLHIQFHFLSSILREAGR